MCRLLAEQQRQRTVIPSRAPRLVCAGYPCLPARQHLVWHDFTFQGTPAEHHKSFYAERPGPTLQVKPPLQRRLTHFPQPPLRHRLTSRCQPPPSGPPSAGTPGQPGRPGRRDAAGRVRRCAEVPRCHRRRKARAPVRRGAGTPGRPGRRRARGAEVPQAPRGPGTAVPGRACTDRWQAIRTSRLPGISRFVGQAVRANRVRVQLVSL
jgi:hypothetical protein